MSENEENTQIPKVSLRKAFEIALKEKKYKSKKIKNAGDSVFYILTIEIAKHNNLFDMFELHMQFSAPNSFLFHFLPLSITCASTLKGQKVEEDCTHLVKLFNREDYKIQSEMLLNAFGPDILDHS